MRVEHIGLNVENPEEMIEWYQENLQIQVIREDPYFIGDETGEVIFELYYNPEEEVMDLESMDPLYLHIAFMSDNVEKDRKRLIEAGATPQGEITDSDGDVLAMLKDPWGLPIQLANRKEPMK